MTPIPTSTTRRTTATEFERTSDGRIVLWCAPSGSAADQVKNGWPQSGAFICTNVPLGDTNTNLIEFHVAATDDELRKFELPPPGGRRACTKPRTFMFRLQASWLAKRAAMRLPEELPEVVLLFELLDLPNEPSGTMRSPSTSVRLQNARAALEAIPIGSDNGSMTAEEAYDYHKAMTELWDASVAERPAAPEAKKSRRRKAASP